MSLRILVNREESEVRVAFVRDGQLVELHSERIGDQTIVNNIYRGRVQDVVPGLQAAFIDVGLGRNMFLHFMDIRPESLVIGEEDLESALADASEKDTPGRIERRGRRPRQDPHAPQAASPVKRGDEIIVQVVKDEIGGKAPRVTANLSLAGRYLVLLPFPSQEGGVSRKIAQGQDRFRLKKLLADIKNEHHSFIIRTAGVDQPEENLRLDAENLEGMWESITTRYKELKAPGLLYNDHNLLTRLIRDAFPSDFHEVICDDADDAEVVRQELRGIMHLDDDRVRVVQPVENLFEHFGIEENLRVAMDRRVPLKSGGYLIIDENEALTAIDVNTGKFTGNKDQEKTSLRTNLEACDAIGEQIRLRDIGGIIVVDFIDMLSKAHQDKVSDALRHALRHDRAKTAIGRIGDFGVCVMTRKRQRMSLQNHVYDPCPYCDGSGLVLSEDETVRRLKYDLRRALSEEKNVGGVMITAHPKLIHVVRHRAASLMKQLRSDRQIKLMYNEDPEYHREDYTLTPVRRIEGAITRVPGKRVEPKQRIAATLESDADIKNSGVYLEDGVVPPRAYRDAEDEIFERAMEEETGASRAVAREVDGKPNTGRHQQPAKDEGDGGRRRRRRGGSGQDPDRNDNPQPRDNGGAPEPRIQGNMPWDAPAGAEDPEFTMADDALEDPALSESSGESTAVESNGIPPEGEDQTEEGRRRTRRGSRGGRRRRGRSGSETAPEADAESLTAEESAPRTPVARQAREARPAAPEVRDPQRDRGPRGRAQTLQTVYGPLEVPAYQLFRSTAMPAPIAEVASESVMGMTAPAPIAAAVVAPKAPEPVVPAAPPKPLPPLRGVVKANTADGDMFEGFLARLETQLEEIKHVIAPEPAPKAAKAAKQPAPKQPVFDFSMIDNILAEAHNAVEATHVPVTRAEEAPKKGRAKKPAPPPTKPVKAAVKEPAAKAAAKKGAKPKAGESVTKEAKPAKVGKKVAADKRSPRPLSELDPKPVPTLEESDDDE